VRHESEVNCVCLKSDRPLCCGEVKHKSLRSRGETQESEVKCECLIKSVVLCVWCSVEISSFTVILQVNRLSAWQLTTSTGTSIHTRCHTRTIPYTDNNSDTCIDVYISLLQKLNDLLFMILFIGWDSFHHWVVVIHWTIYITIRYDAMWCDVLNIVRDINHILYSTHCSSDIFGYENNFFLFQFQLSYGDLISITVLILVVKEF